MTNLDQSIPCPVCQTLIPFDAKELLSGTQFTCPNDSCDASISLAVESKSQVGEAIKKFEQIKND